MKEMIYKKKKKIEILDKGTSCWLDYYIVSYWTHPCAYVILNDEHPAFGVGYEILNLYFTDDYLCNWWFTYAENRLLDVVDVKDDKWVIWWDYAHCDDFCWTYIDTASEFNWRYKKWTTEKIKKEVKNVCIKLCEGDNALDNLIWFIRWFNKGYEWGKMWLEL